MTVLETRRKKALDLAYMLGIPLYLRSDGGIAQFPPGERIEPPQGAVPTPHGRGPQAAAEP
ncbi:MAG TPA: hypothetical protein VJ770_21255 [Stellaceae bacterium]|nr:hypothetical protein [Stellaceae bacterium]